MKTNPIVSAVRTHAVTHRTSSNYWNRVSRWSPARLESLVGNRNSVENALKAVRQYMRDQLAA